MGNTSLQMDGNAGYQDRVNRVGMKAKNWNLVSGVAQDVFTYYDTPVTANWNWTPAYGTAASGTGKKTRITLPDNTKQDIYFFDSGWQRGMAGYTETLDSANVMQRRTGSIFTQDNTGLNYRLNPRVTETAVGDPAGNNRRTKVTYGTAFNLPQDTEEFAANGTSILRRTHIDYVSSSVTANGEYYNLRLIGLPEYTYLYDENNQLVSQSKLEYDASANILALPSSAAATQHDASYTASAKRGLVTKTIRYKTSSPSGDSSPATIASEAGYYVTGSAAFARDPLGHQSNISYTDAFSDNINRNTFAYPTTATDPDGFSSAVKYNYNFGGVTRTEGPPPQNNPNGAIQTTTYDGIGRVQQVTNVNTGAYTTYGYGPDYTLSWATINTLAQEAMSVQITDGLGQVILAASEHPSSTGGYKGQTTEYDKMGRAVRVSNPAEVNSSWAPIGDDASGWRYTSQTYDWKGRPRVTHREWETNTDSDTEIEYSGCGCAGGEVVTVNGENVRENSNEPVKRRRQRTYHDILGREVKTEILNWDQSVYSTTLTEYNSRDQIIFLKQFSGTAVIGSSCQTGCQQSEYQYDGHGRQWKTHLPQYDSNTFATTNYNSDDVISSASDARGASVNYTYNSRHLLTAKSYSAPSGSGIAVPTAESYSYDGAGNRLSMTDASGTSTYTYNQLSQMTSETQTLNNTPYTINYNGYNLSGALTSYTAVGTTINYSFDKTGRLTGVSGSSNLAVPQIISNLQYRAWGAIKHLNYGSGAQVDMTYNANQLTSGYTFSNVGGSYIPTASYTYYPDNRIRSAESPYSDNFDRAFRYDQAGRLQEALTGSEAHGSTTTDGPYRQTYNYDAWSNTTSGTTRLYNSGVVNFSSPFTNNRRSGGSYDSTGQITQDDNGGSHLMDAGQRFAKFKSNDLWITSPTSSSVESTNTYNGNGAPVKVEKLRRYPAWIPEWGNYNILTWTETSYYLRSSVLGGQAIYELNYHSNNAGGEPISQGGAIYAQGMKLASYSHNYYLNKENVTWGFKDPVTGSDFGVGGTNFETGNAVSYFGIQEELDPLGADVTTEPPLPPEEGGLYLEPPYLNPNKTQFWPIEIEGGPSEEYLRNNAQWDSYMRYMSATYGERETERKQNEKDRAAAEAAFARRDMKAVQAILEKNPNVGIIIKDENGTRTVWGKDAADFFNSSGQQISFTPAPTRLSAEEQRNYDKARDEILLKLIPGSSTFSKDCFEFLRSKGITVDRIVNEINRQQPFSGRRSDNITMVQAGLIPAPTANSIPSEVTFGNRTVGDVFRNWRPGNLRAMTANYGPNPNHIYFDSDGFRGLTILHEALHSLTGDGDRVLAARLGQGIIMDGNAASGAISQTLSDHGCK